MKYQSQKRWAIDAEIISDRSDLLCEEVINYARILGKLVYKCGGMQAYIGDEYFHSVHIWATAEANIIAVKSLVAQMCNAGCTCDDYGLVSTVPLQVKIREAEEQVAQLEEMLANAKNKLALLRLQDSRSTGRKDKTGRTIYTGMLVKATSAYRTIVGRVSCLNSVDDTYYAKYFLQLQNGAQESLYQFTDPALEIID